VLGMGAADVLLHGPVSFFLCTPASASTRASACCGCYDAGISWGQGHGHTPVQRFRHAEPSWFRSGHTTTLFSSFTEKEPVKGGRGGMASIGQSMLAGAAKRRLGQSGVGAGQWQRDGYETLRPGCVRAPERVSARRRDRVAGSEARGSSVGSAVVGGCE
jgi:hypothetical protein